MNNTSITTADIARANGDRFAAATAKLNKCAATREHLADVELVKHVLAEGGIDDSDLSWYELKRAQRLVDAGKLELTKWTVGDLINATADGCFMVKEASDQAKADEIADDIRRAADAKAGIEHDLAHKLADAACLADECELALELLERAVGATGRRGFFASLATANRIMNIKARIARTVANG